MNRDVIAGFFFAVSLCRETEPRSETSLFLPSSGKPEANHEGLWRLYKNNLRGITICVENGRLVLSS